MFRIRDMIRARVSRDSRVMVEGLIKIRVRVTVTKVRVSIQVRIRSSLGLMTAILHHFQQFS